MVFHDEEKILLSKFSGNQISEIYQKALNNEISLYVYDDLDKKYKLTSKDISCLNAVHPQPYLICFPIPRENMISLSQKHERNIDYKFIFLTNHDYEKLNTTSLLNTDKNFKGLESLNDEQFYKICENAINKKIKLYCYDNQDTLQELTNTDISQIKARHPEKCRIMPNKNAKIADLFAEKDINYKNLIVYESDYNLFFPKSESLSNLSSELSPNKNSLATKERNNLLKAIGGLTMLYVDLKASEKYKSPKDPNIEQVIKDLHDCLGKHITIYKDTPPDGLKRSNLGQKIKEGIELLLETKA